MRILAVSSQVAFGPVGNSAAVPALQAMGHEVLAVPTAILSHHPGHGRPATLRIAAPDLAAMLGSLDGLGALDSCGAAMTGYFVANEQIHDVARILRRMKDKNPALYVMVDPIIGDRGALYVPLPVAEAIRDVLLPLAACATPNRFELEWLTGLACDDPARAEIAARRLGVAEVLATSIPAGYGRLATLAVVEDRLHEIRTDARNDVPHGTGDFLAGLYLARRANGESPGAALAEAMAILDRAIALSADCAVLNVTGALLCSSKAAP
jgi:pyridoxine kinase